MQRVVRCDLRGRRAGVGADRPKRRVSGHTVKVRRGSRGVGPDRVELYMKRGVTEEGSGPVYQSRSSPYSSETC